MDRAEAVRIADQAGFAVSDSAWRGLETHVQLLRKWQSAINLVGPATLSDVWGRHVLDSLQLLPLIPQTARTVVDLGSGAGFPGLVLAIVRPELKVRLIESDARKAAFLREVSRSVAPGVMVVNARIEAVTAGSADIVTARALAPLPKLLPLADKFMTDPAICLFHKGEDVDSELTAAQSHWMMDVDRVPSVTAPGAAILRIARLRSRR
jgi:16S rRNA (guanine527-N7)-methyltransferase